MINEVVLRSVLHTLTELIYSEMKKNKTDEEKNFLISYEDAILKLVDEKLLIN